MNISVNDLIPEPTYLENSDPAKFFTYVLGVEKEQKKYALFLYELNDRAVDDGLFHYQLLRVITHGYRHITMLKAGYIQCSYLLKDNEEPSVIITSVGSAWTAGRDVTEADLILRKGLKQKVKDRSFPKFHIRL